MGSDVAQTFEQWKGADWMAANLRIWVIHRLGYDWSPSDGMGIHGAYDAGLRGIEAASERLQRSAVTTSRSETAGDVGAVADRTLASHELRVSAATRRTADDMVGTLLDIVAVGVISSACSHPNQARLR